MVLPSLLARLLNALSKLARLSSLTLIAPKAECHIWAQVFCNAHLLLPNVQTLTLGPSYESMIRTCPNVRAINGQKFYFSTGNEERVLALIAAAGSARKIEHFECRTWWTKKMVGGESFVSVHL